MPTNFYSIRLLIKHPSWKVKDVTDRLGEQPTYSWNAGENGKSETMWSLVSNTTGERLFFDEVKEVLSWIQARGTFSEELGASGGTVSIIVELPGSVNLGDTIDPETMKLAAKLQVSLGIEVFPGMKTPTLKT